MSKITVFLIVATLVLVVSGQHGQQGASYSQFVGPVRGHAQEVIGIAKDKHGNEHKIVDYKAEPYYQFKYGVADQHTGNFQNHQEYHDGQNVQGEYSLKEDDGNIRTVKYLVDKDGFHAEVTNSNHHTHPVHHGHK